jgi:hypothetical protein
VIGGEPLDTKWVRLKEDEGYLVRWMFGDSDADIDAAVLRAPSLLFSKVDLYIEIGGPMRLFDSAFPGDQIVTSSARVEVPVGTYAIATAEYSPDSHTSILLHKLQRDA